MKSYQAISEKAGTTVEVVRVIAKTIKRDEAGAWLTKDGKACKTKAQAIVEAARAWEAARAKRDAQEAARLDMCRQARDVMAANGVEIPADPDETMRIAERLQNLAAAKHVGMERLDADDVATAVSFDGYMVLTVKAAPRTTVIVRDMVRHDGKTWETAHFGAIPAGAPVQATALKCVENWQIPTMMFGALDDRGDVNSVLIWQRRNGTRDVFTADRHKDGARLDVEVSKTIGGKPNSPLTIWHERGYVPAMREAWDMDTCVFEADGTAHGGRTNPTIAPGGSTDFEWILEATAANRWRLLVEVLRRWAE